MTRYMCLVSGEVFSGKDEAAAHAQDTHNLTFGDALDVNGLFVKLDDDEDAERRYQEEVENR